MRTHAGADQVTYVADFTQGNITKHLLRFATPLFLSSLLQIVYNMVDMIIVGRALGEVGLSAVSVGGDVTNFLTFLAMGFSNAGQVIISQYIGAGERKKIGRFVGTMFTFLIGCAAILSVVCLLLREPILRIMNTPESAYSETLGYATVCISGLVFIYGYNIISAVLRGLGDSRHPFIFISIASCINVVLDLVFVLVFGLGSAGAALATVISQAVSFFSCSVFIYLYRERFEILVTRREFISIEPVMFLRLIKLGLPMAIKSGAILFSKLFVNSWINSYGVAVSAFAGIANKINGAANLFSQSFTTAGSSMVGQNISAGKHERTKGIILVTYSITLAIAAGLSALFFLFPRQIYGIFTDSNNSEVIEIGLKFLPIAAICFFGNASRSGMNALIDGSGNTIVNFITAIFDGIILRIGLALFLGITLDMRHWGFWLGDALSGYTPFIVGLIFFFTGAWKKSSVSTDSR